MERQKIELKTENPELQPEDLLSEDLLSEDLLAEDEFGEMERICRNCASFFQHYDDMPGDWGVCMYDQDFEPYLDEIMDGNDFDCCRELYDAKRFDASGEPCEKFEFPHVMTMEELARYRLTLEDPEVTLSELRAQLYHEDPTVTAAAIQSLSLYLAWPDDNRLALLREYYLGLGPAQTLEDGQTRKKILETLRRRLSEAEFTQTLVHELYRSPSNNTTRGLLTYVLNQLERLPLDIIEEPLLELLEKKKFSPRFKKRIQDLTIEPEPFDGWFFF